MANGHGGYRKPSDPKHFSGQGKFSERTDGGPADMATQPIRPMPADGQYGARKASVEAQSAAPMSGGLASIPEPSLAGLFDDTTNPNEPVTAGNVLGPGAGPEALQVPNTKPSVTSTLRRLAQVDETGEAEYVLQMLSERGIL